MSDIAAHLDGPVMRMQLAVPPGGGVDAGTRHGRRVRSPFGQQQALDRGNMRSILPTSVVAYPERTNARPPLVEQLDRTCVPVVTLVVLR